MFILAALVLCFAAGASANVIHIDSIENVTNVENVTAGTCGAVYSWDQFATCTDVDGDAWIEDIGSSTQIFVPVRRPFGRLST